MTSSDPSVLLSKASARRAGLFLCLMGGAFPAAGCGSSSSDAPPFSEFEGVWAINVGDDNSAITCPSEVNLDNVPFTIVSSAMTIQAGVLTDLVETDTLCRFNYDVMGKIATMPTTDPYTGKPPTCTISLSSSDGSNVVLDPNATPVWTFKLLAPVTGQAPAAQIIGTADAAVTLADSNGNLQKLTACTFAAHIDLHKIAKP